MTPQTWTRELAWHGALALVAFIIGVLTGHAPVAVLLALLAFLCWHLYWLFRLERWLVHERRAVPPEAPGIWGEVFHQLYRHYRRNRQRRLRIARMIRAFRRSTAAMPDGTVALNRHGQIEWFNDAAGQLLGLSRQQDAGQRIANLLRNPVFIAHLAGEEFDEPVEIASPHDDDRRLSLQLVPYGEGEQLLLVRDVTRLRRLEQMRREFVANASHELRSPLTVIAGYLESLDDALNDGDGIDKEWLTPVRDMREQAMRMSDIIADLLELARLETAPPADADEAIDVRKLLMRIRSEALALGEGPRDIELVFETDVQLFGTEKEIHSAFSNLVFNAMRYTPAEGRVTIRWHRRRHSACLSVRDTGVGIAKEHIPRITERFYRVDSGRARSKGGTGLGLAIVKHVLLRHDAQLEIESAPGKGSTFICVFPPRRVIEAV